MEIIIRGIGYLPDLVISAPHSLHFAPKMSLLSTKKLGRVLMNTSIDVACETCAFPRILRENLRWSIFPCGNISKRIKSAQSEEL